MNAGRSPELPNLPQTPKLPEFPALPGMSGQDGEVTGGQLGVAGLGMDLVHVPGMVEQLAMPGTAFAQRSFTSRELREAARRSQERGAGKAGQAEHLAVRWAAKEAFIKAWSQALALVAQTSGASAAPVISPQELNWREIELRTDRWGRPWLHLSGQVAQAVADTFGPGAQAPQRWPVSLSHEGDWAAAIVLFQAG